ncbi:MAG: hypothetical protein G01um101470_893 [Parcubacteria group bacterium Gr01-1014_70]|nr:MAG: hypothetical protein G01um101470_893 [Parcubacteria group bacterium Gr01-1014_70]
MTILDWRLRKKLFFFLIFAVIVLLVAGFVAYRIIPEPSCTDRRQNQEEERIDCGGPNCAPCIEEKPDNLVVLWQRFFEVRTGVYDVAALVQNVNLTIGSDDVPYTFELFDKEGTRIIQKKANTYVLPNQQFLVFEGGLETGIRVPVRVSFQIKPFQWRPAEEQALPVIVSRSERQFTLERPRLLATITNNAFYDIRGLDVAVVVSDINGNAVGVGLSHVKLLPDSKNVEVAYTWPHPFAALPSDVRYIIRKNPWLGL